MKHRIDILVSHRYTSLTCRGPQPTDVDAKPWKSFAVRDEVASLGRYGRHQVESG